MTRTFEIQIEMESLRMRVQPAGEIAEPGHSPMFIGTLRECNCLIGHLAGSRRKMSAMNKIKRRKK